MAREPNPSPSPRTLSLRDALPGILGLTHGLTEAWPELGPPTLEAGLTRGDAQLPALRLRPRGAPEVLIAWSEGDISDEERASWLDNLAGDEPLEVFLFAPDALPPAPALLGFVLERGRRDPVPPRDGLVESMALGVFLRPERARLRVVLPGGEPVPFPDELAQRLTQAKAEITRWRQKAERKDGDQTRMRTEMERQKLRAEHWKAEARRLKERLGEASAGEEPTAEILIGKG